MVLRSSAIHRFSKLSLPLTANIKTTFGLLNDQMQNPTDLLKEITEGCFDDHRAERICERH